MTNALPGTQPYRTIQTASKRTGELYVIKLYSDASAVCSCPFGTRNGLQIEGQTRACKHVKTVWLGSTNMEQSNAVEIPSTVTELERWQSAADYLDFPLEDFIRYAANELADRIEQGKW